MQHHRNFARSRITGGTFARRSFFFSYSDGIHLPLCIQGLHINDLAAKGKAIIVVSSELPELVGLCDRVLVVREGRIVGAVEGDDISEDKLISLAMGVGT